MRFSFGRSTPAIRAKTFLLELRPFGARQPWRCLWRGFLQMIRTTPLRRTTLQLSQIRVTEAFTFMALPFLFVAVDDAPAGEIVSRELHRDLVPGQDLDEVHPHLARDVGQN